MALMCSTSMLSLFRKGRRIVAGTCGRPSGQERFHEVGDVFGAVVMEHVPCGRDDVPSHVADDVEPLVEFGLAVAVAPPDADVGSVAFDPEHRRADPLPELEPFVDV